MDDHRSLADILSAKIRRPEDAGGKRIHCGAVLEAPRSGRIAAMEMPPPPEGVVILTKSDIPGPSKITLGGVPMPILASRRALWPGQPLIAASGSDRDELYDWLSHVEPVIESESEQSGRPPLEKILEKGDPRRVFSRAFQVIEEFLEISPRPSGTRSGGLTCLKDGSSYILHTAGPWPAAARWHAARVLKTGIENICIKSYPSSPGADVNTELWYPVTDACRAVLLAAKAKRSIRFPSLSTSAPASMHPGGHFHVRGAVDDEGRILALDIDITIETGCVFPFENEFLDRVILGIFGMTPCRNYRVHSRILHKDGAPGVPGPAAGSELGILAGETFVSKVAEMSLMPPAHWRILHFPVTGRTFGPGVAMNRDVPFLQVMNRVLEVSHFERKHAAYEQNKLARSGMVRQPASFSGIGLSTCCSGNGFTAAARELQPSALTAILEKDGNLSVGMHPSGDALQQAWSGLADSILGLEGKSVRFVGDKSESSHFNGPSLLGHRVSVQTKLLELTCNDLAKRRFRDPLPIVSTRSRRRGNRKSWDPELFEGSPFDIISWGAGIVELTICPRTMRITPKRIWLEIDAGVLLDAKAAENAVEAAAWEALNWCMGRPETSKRPEILVEFLPAKSRSGSKDASTLPWLLVPAAYLQALRQASGTETNFFPPNPARLLKQDGIR